MTAVTEIRSHTVGLLPSRVLGRYAFRPAYIMTLESKVVRSGKVAVVVCRGRIVFGSETTELSRTVRSLLDQSPWVVLDLGAVQTIDSGGLGTLLGLVASARRNGGDLKLCNLSRKADEVLRLTKLAEVVETFPDQAAAVAAFPA